MTSYERREKILAYIEKNQSAAVGELTAEFNASESTIRRDLAALSALGKINKFYGGATVLKQEFINSEARIDVKSLENIGEKTKIAKYAASLIKDEDFVFIDAGSTTYILASYIENPNATYVTTGIAHASLLAKKGFKVIIIGGEFKEQTEAIIGLVAAYNLQKYNFSKAFVGTNGISERQGFTTPDTDEAMIKAIAIERSFASYILADHSKFGKVSAVTFSPLDSSCIICDKCNDDIIKEKAIIKEVI